eukprot:TRINITY_DN69813_c0_g1_i1.p2 TRINITY_DN69813_c0_g1~~TRINITY_DN69813_c0_g1_i1.p2  ORF type:complete len:112 (-),score=19.16 TRINITY_DN69813_c0_g1_i1:41-376(-)
MSIFAKLTTTQNVLIALVCAVVVRSLLAHVGAMEASVSGHCSHVDEYDVFEVLRDLKSLLCFVVGIAVCAMLTSGNTGGESSDATSDDGDVRDDEATRAVPCRTFDLLACM